MLVVEALHFLEEDEIGPQDAQLFPHFVDHDLLMEARKALVDVVGDDLQGQGHGHGREHEPASSRYFLPASASLSAAF